MSYGIGLRTVFGFILINLTFFGCKSPVKSAMLDGIVPDVNTRVIANQIQDGQIDDLRIYGYNFGVSIMNPLLVNDPTLIHQFLMALREATSLRYRYLDRADTMEIHFKRSKHPPELLKFCAGLSTSGFGDKFEQVLNTLAKYQAKKAREEVHALRRDVVAAEVKGDKRIIEGLDLEVFLHELDSTNSRIYAYTDTFVPCTVFLHLKDGTTLHYYFVLGHYNDQELSNPNTLPSVLKNFYLRVLGTRQRKQ